MTNEKLKAEIPDIINQFATAIQVRNSISLIAMFKGRHYHWSGLMLSLQNLYQQGARAFWIHNTGPIGCLAVTLHYLHDPLPTGYVDHLGCVKFQNDMAREFNRQLKLKVNDLREELPLAALTYVDLYTAKYELLANAKQQGIKKKQSSTQTVMIECYFVFNCFLVVWFCRIFGQGKYMLRLSQR